MRVSSFLIAFFLSVSLQIVGDGAFAADEVDPPSAFVSEGSFAAVSGKKRAEQGRPSAEGWQQAPLPVVAETAALPVDDGIDYTYVRTCLAGSRDNLDPENCPLIDARCDAQDDGVLVDWIEINNNVQPATETSTGRSSCMYPGEPPAPPVEGVGAAEEAPIVITLEEFEKQPVLAALIVSQPSNFGLRNAHSNLYADAQEQEFAFDFQDAAIVLKARPVSYQWNYGDGTSAVTSVPGGPVAGDAFDTETPTSHQYTETGDYDLTLTTYFAGDYSVDGGPFQPVAGEAAVVSAPHLMSIWRTQGHNVSQNCIENPTGIGCEAPTR